MCITLIARRLPCNGQSLETFTGYPLLKIRNSRFIFPLFGYRVFLIFGETMFLFGDKEKTCVRIPLDTKGRLFVSPMPFGPYDPGNKLLKIYRQNRIEFAVILVTDSEIEKKAKRDILKLYQQQGIEPIRFPIADYTSPELHAFSKVVDQVSGYLRAGASVAVHCNAGVGRTGVMACCIVRDFSGMTAGEAIDYVRQFMQTNMTEEQIRLVDRFVPLAERLQAEHTATKQMQSD
jgi:protein-tyrosine phosphatase